MDGARGERRRSFCLSLALAQLWGWSGSFYIFVNGVTGIVISDYWQLRYYPAP